MPRHQHFRKDVEGRIHQGGGPQPRRAPNVFRGRTVGTTRWRLALTRMSSATLTHVVDLRVSAERIALQGVEDEGVVRQYATILDHSRINKGLMAICYISLKEHNKKSGAKFIKTISDMPEVIEFYIISGAFDFMLKVVSGNMDDYYNFHVNKLGQVDNIAQVQSTFIMGTIKAGQPVIS